MGILGWLNRKLNIVETDPVMNAYYDSVDQEIDRGERRMHFPAHKVEAAREIFRSLSREDLVAEYVRLPHRRNSETALSTPALIDYLVFYGLEQERKASGGNPS